MDVAAAYLQSKAAGRVAPVEFENLAEKKIWNLQRFATGK